MAPYSTDYILRLSGVDPATRVGIVAALPPADRAGILPEALAADAVRSYMQGGAASRHTERAEATKLFNPETLHPTRRALMRAGAALFEGSAGPDVQEVNRVRRAMLALWAGSASDVARGFGIQNDEMSVTVNDIDDMAREAATLAGYTAVKSDPRVATMAGYQNETRAAADRAAQGVEENPFDAAGKFWLAVTDNAGAFPQKAPTGWKDAQWKDLVVVLKERKAAAEKTARVALLRPDGVAKYATAALFPALEARGIGFKELIRRKLAAGATMDEALEMTLNAPKTQPDALTVMDAAEDDLKRREDVRAPNYAARGSFEARLVALTAAVESGTVKASDAMILLASEVRGGGLLTEGHVYRLRQAESVLRQGAWNRVQALTTQPRTESTPTDVLLAVVAAEAVPVDATLVLARSVNAQVFAQLPSATPALVVPQDRPMPRAAQRLL